MIFERFRTGPNGRSIRKLYGMIVAQARLPVFYESYGVPDTLEGRFDLIVLHLVLVLIRFEGSARLGPRIGQELFDVFCRDLDDNLREMGVGDLAVPKRMRRFGEAFYGRQAAYRSAFVAADDRALVQALARNIFPETIGSAELARPARLARYARAVLHQFEGLDEAAMLRGEVAFPLPDVVSAA